MTTGFAGRPEEYFWPDFELKYGGLLGIQISAGGASYVDYINSVIERGSTPNGVFGAKMMGRHLRFHVIPQLRRISEYQDMSLGDLLSTVFPNLRYVYITRRDKVRQAISLVKAFQTNVWKSTDALPPRLKEEPVFDYTDIERQVEILTAEDDIWQQHFTTYGIQPFTIVYEEFVEAYEQTRRDTLSYLGIRVPKTLTLRPPRLKKQADLESDDWVRRFYEHLQVEGAAPLSNENGEKPFVEPVGEQESITYFDESQVKTEAVLRAYPMVREAIVVSRRLDNGNVRLIAYVVPSGFPSPSELELRIHLRRSLPEHTIPEAFVTLRTVPRTLSGNVDHRALPLPGPKTR